MYQFVYNFVKEDNFPLTAGVFEGELAMIPRNTYTVLQRSYDVDLCTNTLYSHKNEVLVTAKLCRCLVKDYGLILLLYSDLVTMELFVSIWLTKQLWYVYKIVTDHIKCHDNMS